jgi:exodeoxyribonuclease-3
MQVVTWNVNSVSARLDFVLDFLETRQPDVVCLQELKTTDDDFPRLAFAQVGYASVAHGQQQWNGVAVLSRKSAGPAPELVQAGLPGQEAMGARLVTVKVFGMEVTSVYVPNGKSVEHADYARKLAWLDALVAHLRGAASRDVPVIVAGDFNIAPTDLDTWDPKGLAGHVFHTDEERARVRALLDLGLVDLHRKVHPDEQAFTWWDYRGGAFHKKQGLRIDWLLGNAAAAARCTEVRVDRDFRKKRDERTPSDHAPVIAELG